MPTPDPRSSVPARRAGLGVVPSPPATADPLDLDALSAADLRAQLDARERDLKYHVEALKHEATTIADDVNVAGRPLMDYVREAPILVVALTTGAGALVGALVGWRARRKRRAKRPEDTVDFVRARLAYALEEASERVAEGDDVEAAIRRSMRTMPVVYGDSSVAPKTAREQAFEVALTTAVGFAVKKAADVLVRRYTPHDGAIDALEDAAD